MSPDGAPKVDKVISELIIEEQDAFQHISLFLKNSISSERAEQMEALCAVAESLATTDADRAAIQQMNFRTLSEAEPNLLFPVKSELESPSKSNHALQTASTPGLLDTTTSTTCKRKFNPLITVKEEMQDNLPQAKIKSDACSAGFSAHNEASDNDSGDAVENAKRLAKKEAKKAKKEAKKKVKQEYS
jgi:hypothetical protein